MNGSPLKFILLLFCSSFLFGQNVERLIENDNPQQSKDELLSFLDSIFVSEQDPISLRDQYMRKYGVESKQALEQQEIYERNHAVNEVKIKMLLDANGWPDIHLIGEQGNITLCNVLQHSPEEVRVKYLPMMKNAVETKGLNPQLLVRAEDRLATDRGDLQIYGGQMKYYPETKNFNVWPVFDPENIDKRRAKLGLPPIEEYLKWKFDFDWDLDEQIQRTEEFMVQNSIKP